MASYFIIMHVDILSVSPFLFDVLINNLVFSFCYLLVAERVFYDCYHQMIKAELLSSLSNDRHNFMHYFK